MPNIIHYMVWKNSLGKYSFISSNELKKLNSSFATYESNKTPNNWKNLDADFKAWNTGIAVGLVGERTQLGTKKADLEYSILQWKPGAVAAVTTLPSVGWEALAVPVTYGLTPVTVVQQVPAMTRPQIQIVNEAMRRTKAGVEFTRDELIGMRKRNNFGAPTAGSTEEIYITHFGAYDAGRFQKVLINYTGLCVAMDNIPYICDARNTTFGLDGHAACVRKPLIIPPRGKTPLRMNGRVIVLLLRDFFTGRTLNYTGSTDDSVGSLVHELCHGTLNLVDAPSLTSATTWEHQPKQLGNVNHADYGETPVNDDQASGEQQVEWLALKSPSIAIRNCDSYGRFCMEILTSLGK
ncbi:MAG: hypothetical protein GY860_27805 [Desulfobacteraceae bacterium]|nr:hypothetical protein [Desulfobacteraceae bacterium]